MDDAPVRQRRDKPPKALHLAALGAAWALAAGTGTASPLIGPDSGPGAPAWIAVSELPPNESRWTVTIVNVGSASGAPPVPVLQGVPNGTVAVLSDGCAGRVLAPWNACVLDIALERGTGKASAIRIRLDTTDEVHPIAHPPPSWRNDGRTRPP